MSYTSKISAYSQPSVKPPKKDVYKSGQLSFLLKEDGFFLRLEDGFKILLSGPVFNTAITPHSAGSGYKSKSSHSSASAYKQKDPYASISPYSKK